MEVNEYVGLTKYISFIVLGEFYCIKITSVKEIMEFSGVTEVPNTNTFVMGVVNLRGVILTLIDGSDYIASKPTNVTEDSRILVFEDEVSGFPVGILVQSVSCVLSIDDNEILPFVKKGVGQKHVRGLFHENDNVYVVLDELRLFENSNI
jgi:purine-binding chemotaxis protein CheW